jgi:histidine ammonia-lyase
VTVVLHTRSEIDLDAFERVAWLGEGVELAPSALERIADCRRSFLALIESDPELSIYGVTTGRGERASVRLSLEEQEAQARRAAATGFSFGEPLPERVVRGIVFARLANVVEGHAAVGDELARGIAGLLDGRALPAVPARGNGGSGEILALAYLFRELAERHELGLKEGLALINGSPCAAALVADCALAARGRLLLAVHVLALSAEAIAAPLEGYSADLELLWGDENETAALRALRTALDGGSPERRAYQSPVSYRILPRVLGRAYRALAEAESVAEVSLRSVTDNPVYIPPDSTRPLGAVFSTGGYHNAAAAPAMDGLAFAWADLCRIAQRHTEHLLTDPGALGSRSSPVTTLAMVQTAWVEDARATAAPTLLPSGGLRQNDIASPAFFAWDRQCRVASCLDAGLVTLAVAASQSLHETGRPAPPALDELLADIRAHVPVVEEPRSLGPELERLAGAFAARACPG